MPKRILIGLMTAFMLFASSGSWADSLFDQEAAEKHFQNGLRLYFRQMYEPATKEFEDALSIDPDYAQAYYFLGYAYYKLRRFERSRTAFEQAYQMNPEYSPIGRK